MDRSVFESFCYTNKTVKVPIFMYLIIVEEAKNLIYVRSF